MYVDLTKDATTDSGLVEITVESHFVNSGPRPQADIEDSISVWVLGEITHLSLRSYYERTSEWSDRGPAHPLT